MEEVSAVPQNVDHSIWKKLGITQAFDLLLVKACLQMPGTVEELKIRAGEQLTGGALKFWEMSFSELVRDLTRQQVLEKEGEVLGLHPGFGERLRRAQETFEQQVSRVVLDENATLEAIEARAEARAARITQTKKTKKKAPSRPPMVGPVKRATTSEPVTDDTLGLPTKTPQNIPKAVVQPIRAELTPAKKVFTSIRMNRLLDRLDNSTLSKSQLSSRLDLIGPDFDRFLAVCEQCELIRIVRTDLVELHWRGQEFARTADADRRMAVLDLVKELRAYDTRETDTIS